MTKSISRSQVRLITSTNANSEPTRRARCCAPAATPCIGSLRTPTNRCPIRYIGSKTRDGPSPREFTVIRHFMMANLGFSGLPLLVYAHIFGFCDGGFESKSGLAPAEFLFPIVYVDISIVPRE